MIRIFLTTCLVALKAVPPQVPLDPGTLWATHDTKLLASTALPKVEAPPTASRGSAASRSRAGMWVPRTLP